MNKLFQDLCHGRIPGWDSHVHFHQPEEILEKIQNERKYFEWILSPNDFKKFKNLEKLHSKIHAQGYEDTYANAFKLGVMLMCAVFSDGNNR